MFSAAWRRQWPVCRTDQETCRVHARTWLRDLSRAVRNRWAGTTEPPDTVHLVKFCWNVDPTDLSYVDLH